MSSVTQNVVDSVKKLGVSIAYGEKVELGDSTLIPVALVGYGFGAGSGNGAATENASGEGEGAGGGGLSIPVGAYVSDDFGTRFRPNVIALLTVLTPLVCSVGFALPRIIKALKK